jgi:transposase
MTRGTSTPGCSPGFHRFPSPRELMSFLGLTVSEHSSGQRYRRGGLTKTGNRHVRRLLIEVAWQYQPSPSGNAWQRS